ncbi:TonB-dependent receptor [Beijerinckia indica]|uniref:TonB-dependent receptor n=1 Tax=Beijerinckia indica subsp. indica (strain ATCC 9039 / DSM 1715 / NCIMB 8712) TaxID=395963 RepID=B2IHU8_BEII9|nr:TonB-dependent receptor [Beijerinckia indica]ACB95991.1 TonB-dependent receptor [Beijerinckia indica subsp. indica ATCC 9039]
MVPTSRGPTRNRALVLHIPVTLLASASSFFSTPATAQEPVELQDIVVTADHPSLASAAVPPIKQKYQLPQTSQSATAATIAEKINIIDTEDSVKYFPSLFVRKRNYGDTQPTLATRTWGVNSSARSLVYADDLLLSALIANNNTLGAPRWGLVSPEAIDRVDFLYGPFAAAYPGNSMGGVLQITTRMPDKPIAVLSQNEAFQTFNRYGTKDTYRTDQTNVVIGNRSGDFSWFITGNYQNSYSQPLSFITSATFPKNTTGGFAALNKLGAPANVLGAGGLLHSEMANISGKFAYDITSWLQMTYQIGFWSNHTNSSVQTYLRDDTGAATFAGQSSFANNNYTLTEQHLSNALSFKTHTGGVFDWDLSVSNYYFLYDSQKSPYGVTATGAGFTTNGKIARLDGTNWINGDFNGIWRPMGPGSEHEISFGLHADRYFLTNPTYASSVWNSDAESSNSLYTNSRGTTVTKAIWAQDAWRLAQNVKFTLGGRLEQWQAFGGLNLATNATSAGVITSTTIQNQPSLDAVRFSPKVSLNWAPSAEWDITGSFGQAYRFPTVTELYQIVATGATFSVPNPDLRPENVLSEELAIVRKFDSGHVRLSLFNENVSDAIIAQTSFLGVSQTPTTFTMNVDAIRNSGVELAAQKDHFIFDEVDAFGSVTYVDSRILQDAGWASSTGTTVVGKHVPYVPDWRVTAGVTYHPTPNWALTAAMRYSGKQYSTLDNTDVVPQVFGAFDSFIVADVRAQYKLSDQTWINLGIDNINNDKYTLYHPFPGRTFTFGARVQF